jgi:cell division protein FtsN
MKAKLLFISILLVLAAGTAQAGKLGMTDRLGGTYVVSFSTQYGYVKVFLPDDMVGGDTVSASIFSYPEGANESVKNKNLAVLKSYRIHTDVQSASIQAGRITINIPRNMSGSSLRVTLRDGSNRELGYSSALVKLPDSYADRPETPSAFDFETPLIGQSGRLVEIKGPFDGDFATTELTIRGKPAHVISESPRKLVFEAPADLSGSAEIVLNENGVVVKRPFTSLRVVKIGEESSSTVSGVVPKGYSAEAPEAIAPATQIIEETVSTEVISSEPGITEQELPLDSAGVQEEIVQEQIQIETYTQPVNGSDKAQIALLLDTQLNLPLRGAATLVKAEKVDTVVLREVDITEKTESDEQLSVKSHGEEIIEEDILVGEKKDIPSFQKKDISASPRSTNTEGSSYSSKELIERIYESTREDWDKSPPEVSGQPVTGTNVYGKSVREGDVTKSPADNTSFNDRGKYTVQVASFKDPGAAKSFAEKLERKGYRVSVTEAEIAGKGRWSRVRVGKFLTKEQARDYGNRLKREEPGIKSVFITQFN